MTGKGVAEKGKGKGGAEGGGAVKVWLLAAGRIYQEWIADLKLFLVVLLYLKSTAADKVT